MAAQQQDPLVEHEEAVPQAQPDSSGVLASEIPMSDIKLATGLGTGMAARLAQTYSAINTPTTLLDSTSCRIASPYLLPPADTERAGPPIYTTAYRRRIG
ncbi:MAG: hypothetical protein Phyf2KO_26840 [Phycisphaerales bacterium]